MIESTASPAHDTQTASPWVLRFAHLVPQGARVLDLACGGGRHARLFAARGCQVIAVDRDAQALASLERVPGIETRCIDLEAGPWPFAAERQDAIVVTNYLHRPLLTDIFAAVSDHGVLIYETFAHGNEIYGRPANPDHLLVRGELLERAAGRLEVVAFEQGIIVDGGRTAVVQRLAGVGVNRDAMARLVPEAVVR
jgi:SAM-dependent methyltransferase